MNYPEPKLVPGEPKTPEQIQADAQAYRQREQARIDELEAERERRIASGEDRKSYAIRTLDSMIDLHAMRRDDAVRRVTPFGQLGYVQEGQAA